MEEQLIVFDPEDRYTQLNNSGDPPEKLAGTMDFEPFLYRLTKTLKSSDSSRGGRPLSTPSLSLLLEHIGQLAGSILLQAEQTDRGWPHHDSLYPRVGANGADTHIGAIAANFVKDLPGHRRKGPVGHGSVLTHKSGSPFRLPHIWHKKGKCQAAPSIISLIPEKFSPLLPTL
jgi:hypothetical protein